MSTLNLRDPWADMLQRGIILWRHCTFHQGETEVQDVVFDPTDTGSFIGRVSLNSTGLWEPEALSNRISENQYIRGIAMFLDVVPPARWTHLVIAGVSKAFSNPGKPEQGGCLFAKVPTPYDMDAYIEFRQRMFQAQHAELNADFERSVEISSAVWPAGAKKNDARLVVQPAWSDEAYFNYNRISYHEPEVAKEVK